jgi:hypothetical protein
MNWVQFPALLCNQALTEGRGGHCLGTFEADDISVPPQPVKFSICQYTLCGLISLSLFETWKGYGLIGDLNEI